MVNLEKFCLIFLERKMCGVSEEVKEQKLTEAIISNLNNFSMFPNDLSL